MVQTGEISAIITKSTVRAYRFGKRRMEFRIAIKTLHNSFHIRYQDITIWFIDWLRREIVDLFIYPL
jgi:hypothetical protein